MMILLTGFPAGAAGADSEAALLERARAIHDRVIAIDTHVDIPPDFGTQAYDPARAKHPGQQVDLPGMERGGLDAAREPARCPLRGRRTLFGPGA